MKALVTGGAGFIGCHLADALVAAGHQVRVLDDLSTGNADWVPPNAEFIEGTVADESVVRKAVDGVEVVFHQAAHRAVQRSVDHPLTTDEANTRGTLNVLAAAASGGVRRVVYASSSSVYGGALNLPTPESEPLAPRSPYAVTKLAGEHYCRVFAELYGLETVALRYFNVYGPRQSPDSLYATVVPLFVQALSGNERPIVHGDGGQSRDFTYIDDVVAANLRAAMAPATACSGRAYNIAGGTAQSLLDLLELLGDILGVVPHPVFAEPRPGDVRHTKADTSASARDLAHVPRIGFREGLRRTVAAFTADSVDSVDTADSVDSVEPPE